METNINTNIDTTVDTHINTTVDTSVDTDINNKEIISSDPPIIKNIVISGGGHTLLQFLGIVQRLEEKSYFHRKNIEKIYSVSAGTVISILLCLDFDWETINDYFVKRPWHEVYKIHINTFFNTYQTKGIYDTEAFEAFFKPLFDAKDISLGVTLSEFYELTKKELHFFTVEINSFEYVDISYKTYPDLSLMTAIQMSCALPVLIVPICIENKCFIDGGVYCNYPLSFCLEDNNLKEETLGIKKCRTEESERALCINKDSSLIEYITGILASMISRIGIDKNKTKNGEKYVRKIKNEVLCYSSEISLDIMYGLVSSQEKRKEFIENGIDCATHFLEEVATL